MSSGRFSISQVTPLHVAVVGGAGAGKSTIVNFLVGAAIAEANPQAGYTRHPTAYVTAGRTTGWSGHLGFLGPLRKLEQTQPSESGRRRLSGPPAAIDGPRARSAMSSSGIAPT